MKNVFRQKYAVSILCVNNSLFGEIRVCISLVRWGDVVLSCRYLSSASARLAICFLGQITLKCLRKDVYLRCAGKIKRRGFPAAEQWCF